MCFGKDKEKLNDLLETLVNRGPDRGRVTSIAGLEGSFKTTLSRELYVHILTETKPLPSDGAKPWVLFFMQTDKVEDTVRYIASILERKGIMTKEECEGDCLKELSDLTLEKLSECGYESSLIRVAPSDCWLVEDVIEALRMSTIGGSKVASVIVDSPTMVFSSVAFQNDPRESLKMLRDYVTEEGIDLYITSGLDRKNIMRQIEEKASGVPSEIIPNEISPYLDREAQVNVIHYDDGEYFNYIDDEKHTVNLKISRGKHGYHTRNNNK